MVMKTDHVNTLKFKATAMLSAAEKNIKPAQTKPKMVAMSGTISMAIGGR
jgi:hypothetical protein